MPADRPKSSVTAASPDLESGRGPDSDDDLPRYSQRAERAKPCCGSCAVVAWAELGGPKSCACRRCQQRFGGGVGVMDGREGKSRGGGGACVAHWKDDGDAAPHGLGAVEHGLVAQEQLLAAVGRLPGDHGGAAEQHLDAVALRQLGDDPGVVVGQRDLRGGPGGRDGDGRRFGGAFDHGGGPAGEVR